MWTSSFTGPIEHLGRLGPSAAALLTIAVVGCFPRTSRQRLAEREIQVGDVRIAVEVALTEAQRRAGLMHRRHLGEDDGMLFVFPAERILHFYMKNTHVPLSIAFVRADGTIERIADMQPHSLEPVSSGRPCKYALEMRQGWFGRHGIGEGTPLVIPADLTATD